MPQPKRGFAARRTEVRHNWRPSCDCILQVADDFIPLSYHALAAQAARSCMYTTLLLRLLKLCTNAARRSTVPDAGPDLQSPLAYLGSRCMSLPRVAGDWAPAVSTWTVHDVPRTVPTLRLPRGQPAPAPQNPPGLIQNGTTIGSAPVSNDFYILTV